jgi:hypothetical protein
MIINGESGTGRVTVHAEQTHTELAIPCTNNDYVSTTAHQTYGSLYTTMIKFSSYLYTLRSVDANRVTQIKNIQLRMFEDQVRKAHPKVPEMCTPLRDVTFQIMIL